MNAIPQVINEIWQTDKSKVLNLDYAKRIFNKIPIFISIYDIQEIKIVWANKYFLNGLGYYQESFRHISVSSIMDQFDINSRYKLIKTLKYFRKNGNECNTLLYKARSLKKEWIWLLSRNIVYEKNLDGTNKLIISYATEITCPELKKQLSKIQDEEMNNKRYELSQLLSAREKDVLKLIANGHTDKEISEILNISIHTTKTHRKKVIGKFCLKNTASLVKFAVENGLV